MFVLCPPLGLWEAGPAAWAAERWGLVKVPVANLRAASGSLPSGLDYDPNQETQLLYGESVWALEESGEWLKLQAPEQPEYSHRQRWEGYPGWIRKDAVLFVKRVPFANCVVRKKSARLFRRPDEKSPHIVLSLGTRVSCPGGERKDFWEVKTVEGKKAWVKKNEVRLLAPQPPEFARKTILEAASELLGDPYFWGGRSAHMPEQKESVTAVDCSGFTNLAYRVAGVDIPRDSLEQHMKAKKITKEELKPGDLIFSASKDKPEKESHVVIFVDENTVIEAPKTGERVRKIPFQEKYGLPLKDVREGEPAGDRVLYFGTYLQ